jgi:hypothetical protein
MILLDGQLLRTYDGYPCIVRVADMFHLTPGILGNKYTKEGISFRKLTLNHRMDEVKN